MSKKHFPIRLIILGCCIFLSALFVAGEDRDYQKAEDVVAWLYHDFAWEVVMSETPLGVGYFGGQPRDVLERYLSKELAALILNDQECSERNSEPCNVNFLLL
jgi:hypothetical protein